MLSIRKHLCLQSLKTLYIVEKLRDFEKSLFFSEILLVFTLNIVYYNICKHTCVYEVA